MIGPKDIDNMFGKEVVVKETLWDAATDKNILERSVGKIVRVQHVFNSKTPVKLGKVDYEKIESTSLWLDNDYYVNIDYPIHAEHFQIYLNTELSSTIYGE